MILRGNHSLMDLVLKSSKEKNAVLLELAFSFISLLRQLIVACQMHLKICYLKLHT